mmetsp:Transcript_7240/g.16380  ORF Transcript_7240/g.16380 Transcript_7240/m.16380 type:complete len:337 (+) Transcript_7240:78-1088(+)|eukprot:CAMPEP_0197902534 /NCGR_PEP_ID=MMETSP1439-20131203/53705_1 /TAXON_ID=66791 /ORGANISM="Gonyaulax spinifera, Strain CCMP409" /LENGTH=336 /DNA_ID=CAMNT_0043523569 /DNA_START=68 /DNA_END=1078 /DNA_ORIENTATION=-
MPKWLSSIGAGGPSEDEKATAFEQLKGRFGSEEGGVDDQTMQKFLVTRSWKVDDAAVMLQAHLQWRAQNLPVKREEIQHVLDDRKVAVLGSGAGGRPIFMLNFLKLLEVDWTQPGMMDQHIRATVFCAEEMIASMPEGVDQWIAVINCIGIRAPPMEYMQEFNKVLQANYPERAHKIVLYPVPRVIVKLVQSFMWFVPERTREKVSFVSSLDGICEETGLDRGQLPPELLRLPSEFEALEGTSAMEVGAGKKEVHRHKLEAGKSAKWSFHVLEHSVNFELRYLAEGTSGDGEEVTTLARVKEGSGEYSATCDGVLEMRFDNSFSYMTGKSLLVSVT